MATATKTVDYSQYEADLAALLKQNAEEKAPPAGTFNARLRQAEWSFTKNGDPMVSLQGEITGPTNEGRIVFPRAGLWSTARAAGAASLNETSIALGLPAVMLFAQASAIAVGRVTLDEANAELTSVLDQDERYFNVTVTHKEKKGKSGVTNEAETQVDVNYKLTPYTFIAG